MNAFCGEMAEQWNHFAQPKLNVGLIDVITGREQMGERGESIVNGGLNHHTSWTGIANASKTLCLIHFTISAFLRYFEWCDGHAMDTENTLEFLRFVDFCRNVAKSQNIDFDNQILPVIAQKLPLIHKSTLSGTEWEKLIKGMRDVRVKAKDKNKLNLPFVDHTNKNLTMNPPHLAVMDSWSEFMQDQLIAAQDKAVAGGKERNMEFITDNKGKFQLMKELQNILPQADIFMSSSVHLADNIQLDPMAQKKEKLAFLGRDHKLRGVPTNFYSYPWTIFFIYSSRSLLDDKKLPLYPEDGVDDSLKKDSELMVLDVYTCRSKVSQTGLNFPIIMSQGLGVLEHLSYFHYIKDYKDYFGITGNGTETNRQNFHLDLCPDISLSRTTIRRKINDEPKLRKALEFTAYLQQITQHWKSFDQTLICDAKTLYKDIKALGYDWDVLLDTRSYWTPNQYEHPIPFLSIIDLLKMRAGRYEPYWYKK